MKKTMRFLSALAIASSVALVGCGGGAASTSASEATSAATDAVVSEVEEEAAVEETGNRGAATDTLFSEDGIDIREAEVNLVGGTTFNFSVVAANNNDVDKDFDYGRFTIVKGDETFQPTKDVKTLSAKQSYTQWAFPIQDAGSLAVGDAVSICIDGDVILETTVVEF